MDHAIPGCIRDLDWIAPILTRRLDRVVGRWGELYREEFGSGGYYDVDGFRLWHTEDVRGLLRRLDDADALASWFFDRARQQRSRGVPFAEITLSLHLLERAVGEVIEAEGLETETVARTCERFDALNHARIIVLTRAFFDAATCRDRQGHGCVLEEMARLQRDVAKRDRFCGMVGASLPMQELFELLTAASRTRATVLITGESGTGKELAARAIHRLSGDPAERFVPVNCAALPRELMESELFGYRRGAFSGAREDRRGLFQAADGGTLYLDEITELAPDAQAKLLRALQERAVRAVGSTVEEPVTLRVVASTNVPLADALKRGKLRRDLYYRLQGLTIEVPPLRDRLDDVPLLIHHFVDGFRTEHPELGARGFRRAAIEAMQGYLWPGNVRELHSVVERACIVGAGSVLEIGDLPREITQRPEEPGPVEEEPTAVTSINLKDAERDAIARALRASGGNKSRASRMLGISRKQLYVKIDRYGLQNIH